MARRILVERDLTRRVKLTYLQTLQLLEGDRSSEDFLAVGTDFSPVSKLNPKKGGQRVKINQILSSKFAYDPGSTTGKDSDSGWVINNTYTEVDWSKIVYRIGIRDIGLHSFTYAEISSVVSIPINSPKPIWKILVKSKEDIPNNYNSQKSWIDYYITIDEGKTWHRINPVDKPTRFSSDGTVVPRILTINAETPGEDLESKDIRSDVPVKSVRIKYVLMADTSVDNADKSTPVLRSVQVLLYPLNGLSGADEQQVL